MEQLSNEIIEETAINFLERQLTVNTKIRPIISKNDKTPSWDGEIMLYEDSSHRKDKLVGKCPVQVKGHQCSDHDELNKTTVSYSVEMSDIKNYEQDGGIIFFVVYLHWDESGKRDYRIYFRSLQRNELWGFLQDKDGQDTASIEFYKFPEKAKEMEEVFLKFIENQKKQCFFVRDENKTIVPITNQTKYLLLDITPQNMFDGKAKTIYRKNPSCPTMAFDSIFVILEAEFKDVPMPVFVDEEKFFSRATVNFKKNGVVNKIFLNHGLHLTMKKNGKEATLQMKTNCNMEECIQNLRFMIALKKAHKLTVGKFAETEQFQINDPNNTLEDALEVFLQIKKLFEVMHVEMKKDVLVSKISDEMMRKFLNLYQCIVLNQDYEETKRKINEKVMITVGPYSFLLIKMIKKDGRAHLYKFEDAELSLRIGPTYEDSVPSVSAFLLSEDDIRDADNIDYEFIWKAITSLQYGDLVASNANQLLLRLLNAYDEKNRAGIKRTDWLSCAEHLAKWQWENEKADNFYMNVLQVFARQRHLNEDEEDELFAIDRRAEGKDALQFHAGVAALLGNRVAYRNYLKSMDEDEKSWFEQLPISNLMKNN